MLLGGWECDPVYLHMQPFLFQKHFQYKLIINNNIMITIIGVPMVVNNLTSMDYQRVGSDNLIFIKVLFMLNADMCFISGIFLAKFSKARDI